VRVLRTVILATVAAATIAAGAGSALADPSVSPAVTSITAVGSDTTQFLGDRFSTDYNASSPAPAAPFYSWDAVNPTTGQPGDTIKTKNDANCSITRPNGSGAGIAQLQKKLKTSNGVDYCVDVARASRNIKSSDGAGITSVLFAKDLITWAANTGGNAVANLTTTDLTAIYTCNASLINSSFSGAVKWSEVGGTSTDAIIPVLPQASSGTRAQWLTDIAVTTPGSCVVNGTYNGASIEENEGNNAVYTPAGNPTGYKDVLAIFSGGDFVCQVDTKACPDVHGTLALKNIDGKAPLTSSNTINVTGLTAFGATYIRGLYFVALNAGTATAPKVPTSPVDLTKFLGQGNATGWICSSTTAKADTAKFGFVVPSNCGTLTGQ
jgi:ABC-type phosphate transport system substrate-binding protein